MKTKNLFWEGIKNLIKENKTAIANVISAAVTAVIVTLLAALCSCSSVQRISVKQNQGEQSQETTIESDTKIKELSLNFYNHVQLPQTN